MQSLETPNTIGLAQSIKRVRYLPGSRTRPLLCGPGGVVETKYCPGCKTTKPTTAFSKSRGRYDGLQGWCKACKVEQQRSTPEKRRVWDADYRRNNPESIHESNTRWAHKPEVMKRRRARGLARMRRERWTPAAVARQRVRKACRRGELVRPEICSRCGRAPVRGTIHAHHEDYGKPLEVVWVCQKCHTAIHILKEGLNE